MSDTHRFETLVNHAVDGLVVIDADGIVLYANPAAEQLMGHATGGSVGFHLGSPAIQDPTEILVPGGGRPRYVEMRATEIEWEGSEASLASLRDVTERKMAEQTLGERVKELHCLSELGGILGQENIDLDDALRHIVRLLPPAWQFPESSVARITVHAQVYEAGEFDSRVASLSRELVVGGTEVGAVEVGYVREYPAEHEGPFLEEERTLIDMLGERVEKLIHRVTAEEALEESEERYRLLAENTVDVIWTMNSDLQFTYVNSAITRQTGYTPEEFVGTNLADYLDPDTFSRMSGLIERAVAEGQAGVGARVETEMARKDGSKISIEVNASVVFDKNRRAVGFQGTTRDITERKKAEIALRESEERYRTLFETMAHGVLYQDAEGLIVSANPAAERILGLSVDQMKGRTSMHPEWRAVRADGSELPGEEHASMIALRTGEAVHDFTMGVYNPQDEGYRWIKAHSVPQFEPGKSAPYQVFSTFEDFTELRNAEEERRTAQRELRQAQKMEAIGRLAGGVAHDFNNMLCVVLGNAEIALQGLESDHTLHSDISEIHSAAERARDLTRQLLAFARKQTVTPKVLDLNETMESILKMLRRLIGEDVELLWKPGSDLMPISMDPSQIDQILANLVVNARDAIDGVGKITIETGMATLVSHRRSGQPGSLPERYVVVSVRDDGAGMDEQTQEKVFEPFFSTKPEEEGTGLGLSVVYGIVEQNHGFVDVESAVGKGATFTVYLPAADESEIEEYAGERQLLMAIDSETVLLVEDEPSVLKVAVRYLESLGYHVLPAGNPEKALEIGETYGGEIDVLVTDIVMPGMNGLDVLHKLEELRPSLACVFMSGYSEEIVTPHQILADDVHFVEKPFSQETLGRMVREALNH